MDQGTVQFHVILGCEVRKGATYAIMKYEKYNHGLLFSKSNPHSI